MADMEKFKNWGTNNLTGILAIIAGLILFMITYKMILSILIFFLGISLIYFGLLKLRITVITNFIDKVIASIKNFYSSNR
ncbi:MAG: hypothetical protein ABIA74_00385 [bacterium]